MWKQQVSKCAKKIMPFVCSFRLCEWHTSATWQLVLNIKRKENWKERKDEIKGCVWESEREREREKKMVFYYMQGFYAFKPCHLYDNARITTHFSFKVNFLLWILSLSILPFSCYFSHTHTHDFLSHLPQFASRVKYRENDCACLCVCRLYNCPKRKLH